MNIFQSRLWWSDLEDLTSSLHLLFFLLESSSPIEDFILSLNILYLFFGHILFVDHLSDFLLFRVRIIYIF